MNAWTVKWNRTALKELAAIWNSSSDKHAVTQASHRLDSALKRSPQFMGESRVGLRRMVFDSPLCITYELIPDDARVIVLQVGKG